MITKYLPKFSSSINANQLLSFNDQLILVDKQDNKIGQITKELGHKMHSIRQGNIHRAFSVFIFDKDTRLMMHQRSQHKITFPNYWTNSCCSHQLDIIQHAGLEGSEKAARERVIYELNLVIPNDCKMNLVTRILYQGQYDEEWGEFELDYVYFVRLNDCNQIKYNKEEISEIQWIKREEATDFIKNNAFITPWFAKMWHYKLDLWWKQFESNQIKELTQDSGKIIDLNM